MIMHRVARSIGTTGKWGGVLLVLVFVVPYYVRLCRRLLGADAGVPRALRRRRELDPAGNRVVFRRRRVASGRGVKRDQEEDVRVQQERHAIFCTWRVQKKGYERTSVSETGLWGKGAQHTYLNMIRMYVTWSMPPSCTYCSSSSVADMNCNPAAIKS